MYSKKISGSNFFILSKCNIQSIGRAMKNLGFKKETKYNDGKGYSEKGYYTELV